MLNKSEKAVAVLFNFAHGSNGVPISHYNIEFPDKTGVGSPRRLQTGYESHRGEAVLLKLEELTGKEWKVDSYKGSKPHMMTLNLSLKHPEYKNEILREFLVSCITSLHVVGVLGDFDAVGVPDQDIDSLYTASTKDPCNILCIFDMKDNYLGDVCVIPNVQGEDSKDDCDDIVSFNRNLPFLAALLGESAHKKEIEETGRAI